MYIRWDFIFENVDRAPLEDVEQVSKELGTPPILVDGADVCHCRRARLWWLSWTLLDTGEATQDPKGPHLRGRLAGDAGPPQRWLDPGARWEHLSSDPEARLPCFMRWTPRKTPPLLPRGITDCEPEDLKRWEAARHACALYQFRERHCIRDKDGSLRTPSVREREVLLGSTWITQCRRSQAGRQRATLQRQNR